MLRRVHELPIYDHDDVDLPYKLPFMLYELGVKFCLQNAGDMERMGARNLPFYAGTAVAYGLPYEEAVRSLTLSAAEILGIGSFTGSIESGKDATFLSKLKTWTAYINKEAKIIDRYEVFDDFSILPYNELKQFADNPSKYKNTTQILFTHVRGEIPPYVVPEIPLNLFSKWKTVFAGDLHSHSNSQLNIVYPGSPLTTSFHREEITTGYILLDTETLNWEWKEIKLPQLIRLTVNDPSKMLPTDFNHTIYEIVGTIQDLAKIEKHDLLDKKITPINSTNRLNFSKNMKIQDELNLYLMEVLKMSKEDSIELINIYNAYITDEMV
jgi:hypothetical protein